MLLITVILALLYLLSSGITGYTSYKLLRLAIKINSDELYYLTLGFLFLLGFNLLSAVFVLIPLSISSLYLYSVASLLQAFSFLLFILNFIENKRGLFELVPIILSAFLIAGIEGFILSYLTLKNNKVTSNGFALVGLASILAFLSVLMFNPLMLVISEFFNAVGVILLMGGIL